MAEPIGMLVMWRDGSEVVVQLATRGPFSAEEPLRGWRLSGTGDGPGGCFAVLRAPARTYHAPDGWLRAVLAEYAGIDVCEFPPEIPPQSRREYVVREESE